MRGSDRFWSPGRLGSDFLIGDPTGFGGVEVNEFRICGAARLLPRNQVGVVLHDGDGDLVTGLEHVGREALGNNVQRLARVAAEHHLVGAGATSLVYRAQELGDLGAYACDGLGRLNGERVQTAQGIGVHVS
mgnify:CR=1 FL=1